MHELSVAMSLISLAENETKKEECSQILSVNVILGYLSGIDFDSFVFMLDLAKKNTMLENTHFEFDRVRGNGICLSCRHEFLVEDHLAVCPECNGSVIKISGGGEMKVSSIVVEQ